MVGKIGIVTVLYNSGGVLEEFFQTLDNQTYRDFVLYVIDNKSPDNSLICAKKLVETVSFPCVIIQNEENYGIAKGNNIGIKTALKDGCNWVLLSNNDVVLLPTTLEFLYYGLKKVGGNIAVPKIYFHSLDKTIWAAGGYYRKWKGGTGHFGFREKDQGQYDVVRQVEYAPTCFMLINKTVFERVGYMDEWYFVYYDDTDFVWRAIKAGENLFYIPASCLFHKESTSTGVGSPFTLYHLNRNLIYFTFKNDSILKTCFVIITHLGVHFLTHIFIYNKKQFKAEAKGIWDGLKVIAGGK